MRITPMKSLVALLLCLVTIWIPDVDTIKSTDRPSLTALQEFKTKEGGDVNVLEMIGAQYSQFGHCLLNDNDGQKIDAIKASNHYQVERIVEAIFTKWLKGEGTWANIVKCLQHAQLNYLASLIEEMYEDDTHREPSSTSDGETTDTHREPSSTSDGEALVNQQIAIPLGEITSGHKAINPISKHGNYGMLNCSEIITPSELNTDLVCTKDISDCVIKNHEARGLGIILTIDYENTMNGTCKDGSSLLETLVHSNFIVLWLHNIDRQAIYDVMNEVKNLEDNEITRDRVQKYECILVAFSGHGLNNKYIVMQDGLSVADVQRDILTPLLPASIHKFGKVPKVLLIDACRGSFETVGVSTKSSLIADVITKETIPAESNYLLAYATLPEHFSYAYNYYGSAWIQEFATLARESTESIEGVLVSVNENLVKRANEHKIELQQPEIHTTLSRKVYIRPRPPNDHHSHTEL